MERKLDPLAESLKKALLDGIADENRDPEAYDAARFAASLGKSKLMPTVRAPKLRPDGSHADGSEDKPAKSAKSGDIAKRIIDKADE